MKALLYDASSSLILRVIQEFFLSGWCSLNTPTACFVTHVPNKLLTHENK